MKVTVHNVHKTLEPLFCEPHKAKDLLELAHPLFYAEDAVFRRLMPVLQANSFVAKLAEVTNKGVSSQQGFGLFNPNRKLVASQWVYQSFAELSIETQLKNLLLEIADKLKNLPENINVFVLPADPANRRTMLRDCGQAYFATKDLLIVQLWPSKGNMALLKAQLASALAQLSFQIEQPVMTLKDALSWQAKASRCVKELCPEISNAPFLAVQAATDWDAVLAELAELYEVPSYDAIPSNIYGSDGSGVSPLAPVRKLEQEELEYAFEVLEANLAETHVAKIAAFLYGDEIVTSQGHEGQAMPNYAGLELAYRFDASANKTV